MTPTTIRVVCNNTLTITPSDQGAAAVKQPLGITVSHWDDMCTLAARPVLYLAVVLALYARGGRLVYEANARKGIGV